MNGEALVAAGSAHPADPVFKERASGQRGDLRARLVCLIMILSQVIISQATWNSAAFAVDSNRRSLGEYLATWNLDRGSRLALEQPSEWNSAKMRLVIRLLARLELAADEDEAAWTAAAAVVPEAGDRLVRLEGTAVFVATVPLPPEDAELAGRRSLDLVRIKTATGLIDVLAAATPRQWSRWRAIAEPASLVGLPVSNAPGPVPTPPTDPEVAAEWPAEPHDWLFVARRVAWHPPTPLGRLGMDYGLFDSVKDGPQLVAGDTEAFYGMLAAVGRQDRRDLQPARPPVDVVQLIDPGSRWFEGHRGDPVSIAGTARRAIRIEIDDPLRREAVGRDHYWELHVFVPTGLLKVHDRLQETYPLVCCVRTLPDGMPTGQSINERVQVSGFAFKRYGYQLPKLKGEEGSVERRQETPLIIGRRAAWTPQPSTAEASGILGWIFAAVAGLVALLLVLAAFRSAADTRFRRTLERRKLPDRIDLP